jgi:hypothetical protein
VSRWGHLLKGEKSKYSVSHEKQEGMPVEATKSGGDNMGEANPASIVRSLRLLCSCPGSLSSERVELKSF